LEKSFFSHAPFRRAQIRRCDVQKRKFVIILLYLALLWVASAKLVPAMITLPDDVKYRNTVARSERSSKKMDKFLCEKVTTYVHHKLNLSSSVIGGCDVAREERIVQVWLKLHENELPLRERYGVFMVKFSPILPPPRFY